MEGEKEGVIAIGDVRRALMYVLFLLRHTAIITAREDMY